MYMKTKQQKHPSSPNSNRADPGGNQTTGSELYKLINEEVLKLGELQDINLKIMQLTCKMTSLDIGETNKKLEDQINCSKHE